MDDIEQEPKCANCLFFHKYKYFCRRYPPVVMMMPNENNTVTDWPIVDINDWCGEYNEKRST